MHQADLEQAEREIDPHVMIGLTVTLKCDGAAFHGVLKGVTDDFLLIKYKNYPTKKIRRDKVLRITPSKEQPR